jgi:predicted hydrocarbon binding protein
LRHALSAPPADPATFLQETGFAAGEDVYSCFVRWLPAYAGVEDPTELDAAVLSEVLSEFFQSMGWGSMSVERLGEAGLTVDSPDWAEAEPGESTAPGCHYTAGLLSNILGKLAGGDVAVMEVECRSCNDARCRFLAGAPETLQAVFDAMTSGKDYRQALLE